jgi:hypothetical protein
VTQPHDAAGHDGQPAAGDPGRGQDADAPADPPPPPPVTGDPVVDEAVALLQYITTVAMDEQPEVYDRVHRTLQGRLADVEA